MAKKTIEIDPKSLRQINIKIKDLQKKSTLELVKGVSKASLRVEASTKRLTPVRTGLLRNSYTHEIIKEKNKIVGIVGTNLEYAPPVELGSINQRPQPHLRPAFKNNQELIAKDIAEAQKRAIKGVAKR